MSRLPALLLALFATVALAACAGGEGKRRINPPRASVQELAVQADGSWKVTVRLQNFSSVPSTFADVDAQLEVGGQPAGTLKLQPALTVGPESADVAVVSLAPSTGAKTVIASALASQRTVRYRVSGQIRTSEPTDRSYKFEYESALNPAPGLPGVLR